MVYNTFCVPLGADDKFTIDSNTGEIRTSPMPLDREGKSAYFITVTATDAGRRKVNFMKRSC